ncbi:MAG TPA: G1 family glutamic endopeptidase [Candidatus Nitrosopolaris sp.]|nr:G1 family glutamic endopeptidase [Candidatus Nitrosopolaris sp.]
MNTNTIFPNKLRHFKTSWLAAVLAAAYVAALALGLAFSSRAASLPNHMPFRRLLHSTSSNWSGYAAYGAAGSFNSVSANWVQPLVTCSNRQNSYSSFWVGLDGYSDSTVEQIGTEADCSRGHAQYYAWYEMYPHSTVLITTALKAGDSLSASVVYSAKNTFSLKLSDSTSHLTYSTTQRMTSPQLSSAEAIAEAPWSRGVLPLANFGTANFSAALANGQPLGGFTSLDPLTMIDPYGMKSTPTAFDSTKESFSVTWSAS